MDTLDQNRVRRFFGEVARSFPPSRPTSTILVTHLLPDRPFLIEAINSISPIELIIAKPKSVHPETRDWLSKKYPISIATNRFESLTDHLVQINRWPNDRDLIIADIGGYFSSLTIPLRKKFGPRFLGVVEDTENGVQKYEHQSDGGVPVISVARSPLKGPEDYLVGQSIVFSTEALLRRQGDILHGRTACVVGYGKLGRSIAHLLHARHVRTVVFDTDELRLVDALSHGFTVAPSLQKALKGAGLIFCATGNLSIRQLDFDQIESGAYLATVTSSDDELDLNGIKGEYAEKQITDYIRRYEKDGKHFYLLNRGQAVNFIHGAAVGPFIYLVQAEILASLSRLSFGDVPCGITENDTALRQSIAQTWLETFGPPLWRTDP